MLHADFWNTWDQAVLQDAVSTCINGNLELQETEGQRSAPSVNSHLQPAKER